jgi:hypothetical protein
MEMLKGVVMLINNQSSSVNRPEYNAVLLECLRREEALASAEAPPEWRWWDYEPYLEELEHGPNYSPTSWFGRLPDHERQRYLRAIERLERAGLLTTWRRRGRKLSNIKLTAVGRDVALQLRDELPSEVLDIGAVPSHVTDAGESQGPADG